MNCTFESNFVGDDTSLITAELPQFNTTLIFLKCKFQYNKIHNFLVVVTSLDVGVNTLCINITFNKCDFIDNIDGLLYFDSMEGAGCKFNILLIGPVSINGTRIIVDINIMHMKHGSTYSWASEHSKQHSI